jgi:hypothetical protein
MNKLLYLFLILPALIFSQTARQLESDREMRTLEKMYLLDKEIKQESSDSQEKILNYRNEVKGEIRRNRNRLSNEQYSKVIIYEEKYWDIVTNKRKEYNRNIDFLRNEMQLLNNYRNNTLDFLYNQN